MTPRRRLTIAILLTAIAFSAMLVVTGYRVHYWSGIGWAGVNYFPQLAKAQKGKLNVRTSVGGPPGAFALEPGHIMVVFPGTPAARAGIDGTDMIRAINGIPISDLERLRELDQKARTGDVVTYHVIRGKTERDVRVRLEPPIDNTPIQISIAVSILLAISFAAIGLIVFIQRPEDRRAFVFYAMSIVGALSYFGGIALSFDGSNLRGILTTPSGAMMVIFAYVAFALAFAALTLHLALIFPRDRRIVSERPYIIRWVYVIPAYAALMIGCALLLSMAANSPRVMHAVELSLSGRVFRFGAAALAIAGALVALRIAHRAGAEGLKRAFFSRAIQAAFAYVAILAGIAVLLDAFGARGWSLAVFFIGAAAPTLAIIAYPILTFVSLYRSYREAGVEEKRQVKWPLWGTMIALGVKTLFGAFGFLMTILTSARLVGVSTWLSYAHWLDIAPKLVYLLIPISFAVAILKYRLMNIDVIIKKTVAYGILSGLIIVIYLVLVGGLGTMLIHVAGVRSQTMVIASTLVVALVFVPLRNRLQHLVDRNLFRQKYDYPQALRALAAETLAATDLRSYLVFAAETLQQAVQNRSVVIFERRQDDLVTSAKVGLPDSVLGSVRIDANEAMAIDRPLNPQRRPLPEKVAAALRRVDAALAVPIRSNDVLHGVLALGSKLSDSEFDLEDIEFVGSAADQIAITVDRIRLQRDEEDFEQARKIQQSLLPASMPHVEGLDLSGTWKPARAVGGDYYDLLRLSDTQLGVCIGDVAGKGMPAALLMSGLQAAVRASAGPDVSPAELCERVRRVIVQSLSGGRFVTFFYCTIDTAAKRIRYCNAGHNPPALVHADGNSIRLDKGGAVFSRLFSGTPFNGGEVELAGGDRLVLFTDGVSESRDAAGNDYGEERLVEVIAANLHLAAHALVETIVDSVLSFSEGRTDDDLTLVAVAVTQPA